MEKDDKPSLYEYFGGLNPEVVLTFSLLLIQYGILEGSKIESSVYKLFALQNDITSGLIAEDHDDFELNGKRMKILGGSLHYFRVHPMYWRDRLRKYRAAGLNSISV